MYETEGNNLGIYCHFSNGPHSPFMRFTKKDKMNKVYIRKDNFGFDNCFKLLNQKSDGFYIAN